MNDDEILTPEQVEQLTTGLGEILPVTEIYKLGYKSRNAEIASLRAELAAKDTCIGELDSALLSHMDDWAEETIVALRAELAETRRDAAKTMMLLGGERDCLRAELNDVKEQLHYANGTCDLAMKHRNTAETAARQDADIPQSKGFLVIQIKALQLAADTHLKRAAKAEALNRQDAEKIARLRLALEGMLRYAEDHDDRDGASRASDPPEWEAAERALACRSQGGEE